MAEKCKFCGKVHEPNAPEEGERLDRLHAEATNLSTQLMNRYSPADTMYILALTSAMMSITSKPTDAEGSKDIFIEVYASFVDNMASKIGQGGPPPGGLN